MKKIRTLMILSASSLFVAHAALAQTSFSGTNSGSGTTIGAIAALPAVENLSDVICASACSVLTTVTDDWYFTIPSTANTAAIISGLQLSLSSAAGDLNTATLFSTNGLGGSIATMIDTTNILGGFVATLTNGTDTLPPGAYDLRVSATVDAGYTGSYTGTVQFNAVPLPATVWMMLGGIGGLALVARRRKA